MANIMGNVEALRNFFLFRRNTEKPFGELPDPIKFITLSGPTLGYPMPYQLRVSGGGYEIHALRDGSTPSTCVRVSFGPAKPVAGDGMLLRQGESVRCERGFQWVWVSFPQGENDQPIGITDTLRVAITNDPFISLTEGRRHQVEYMTVLSSTSDAAGVPCEEGDLVTIHIVSNATTRLSAAANDIKIWWKMNDPYRLWAHNEADDFTASALGVAGPDHDIESYYTPAGAKQVAPVAASGSYGAYIHVRGFRNAKS